MQETTPDGPLVRRKGGVLGRAFAARAADLKSLTHSWRNRVQGLQIESGTRIMDLLVPMTFRTS
jgi:hypothetical protein